MTIIFDNCDTREQLLARSRYLLFKSVEKWNQKQEARAEYYLTSTGYKEGLLINPFIANDLFPYQSQRSILHQTGKVVQ